MSKILNLQTIINRCFTKYGNEYTILSEVYKKSSDKISVRHNKCNNIWDITVNNFLNKNRKCPYCYGNKKLTIDVIKKRTYDMYNDEYTIISEFYTNNSSKLDIRHNKCGVIFKMCSADFLNSKNKCPNCSNNKKMNFNEIKSRIESVDGYSLISKNYTNTYSKISIKHEICDTTYSVFPYNFFMGKRCPKCSGNKKITIDEFKKLSEINNDFYINYDTYVNMRSKLYTKHTCGNEFYFSAFSLKKKLRCKKCEKIMSLGEEYICNFLNDRNINYQKEKVFDNCRNKLPLPFDFYLSDINTCIEYDGIQHFKPVEYFGGMESLNKTIKNDSIKNKYCLDNNIKLIRINSIDDIESKLSLII